MDLDPEESGGGFIDDDPADIYDDDSFGTTGTLTPSVRPHDAGGLSLQQELLQTAVNDYYNAQAEKGLTPALGRDYTKFELVAGKLRLKAYPNINLTRARTAEPLALSTVAGQRGGGVAITDELGFYDWQRPRRLAPKAVTALQRTEVELGTAAANLENIELADLGAAASASDAVRTVETSMNEVDLNEVIQTIDHPPLDMRELRGLDQALQRIRGELTNNLAKLSEIDRHIEREKEKLADAEDGGLGDDIRERIANRLRSLQEERAARLEAASAIRERMRSQISRVRETIQRILHEDTTLGERIRTLFREQGITIASILTAIGMAISTLVVALTGGTSTSPSPQPPGPGPQPPSGSLKEWVKKHLQALGRVLARLAGKAAASLPGIIGSIVGWVINVLAKTAGWLAEHLWALAIAIGGLLLVAAREYLQAVKRP